MELDEKRIEELAAEYEKSLWSADDLKDLALDYLNEKYGLSFAPIRLDNYNDPFTDPYFMAAIETDEGYTDYTEVLFYRERSEEEENADGTTPVKLPAADEIEWTLTDNYKKYMISKAYCKALNEIVSKYTDRGIAFVQAVMGITYEGKDAEVMLTDDELIKLGSEKMVMARLYLESSEEAEKLDEIAPQLINDIRNAGLYGRYYFYLTEENALLLINEENFLDYLPDNETPDGMICKAIRKERIESEV